MSEQIPPKVHHAFRIILDLEYPESRLDTVLLKSLRDQNDNTSLKAISRAKFKELFTSGKIQIKGQRARASSSIARGLTYIDILGY